MVPPAPGPKVATDMPLMVTRTVSVVPFSTPMPSVTAPRPPQLQAESPRHSRSAKRILAFGCTTSRRYACVELTSHLLLAVAFGVGLAVTFGSAALAHRALVLRYGEDGIAAIDDTPLMLGLVAGVYLAGLVSGLVVLVVGWMRFFRRRV
jgi:hypothetical protein